MIRVIVVGDQDLLCSGVQRLLQDSEDLNALATCPEADAVGAVRRHRPDVVVLSSDDQRPPAGTLSTITELRALPEPPEVAVLTGTADGRFVTESLAAGAAGFLLRDIAPEDLANAVRLVASGSSVLARPASRAVVSGLGTARLPEDARERAAALTDREREVLALLVEGLSNAEIGRRLLLSPATVKDHISAIYLKLGTANRVRTAVFAQRTGAARQPERAQPEGARPATAA
ncbi:response regulator transcription factor [Streptomyces sp. NPDC049577]|uniref:response regulator transcription factor n=1 Tax=Streptomyces sp. NPDC049577 TaxID=3155153 RepID=UPI003431A9BC